MLKNYFTIAIRLLRRNKIFSLINILGLSIGMSCCILIALYIQDELSYEKGFHEYEKIFRINNTGIKDGVEETGPYLSPPVAPGVTAALPGIETYTRIMKPLNTEVHIVRYKDKSFFEERAYLVDSTFLDVFTYELLDGDPATALDGPSSVLISEKLRRKIFDTESPLDELLIINSGTSSDTFRITGVVKKGQLPSRADADIYMSMNSDGWGRWVLGQTTWANNNVVESYLKLRDPSTSQDLEKKFPQLVEMHAGAELRQSGRQRVLTLQPLAKTRLYSDFGQKQDKNSNSITYLYIVGSIGIVIMLLASINFMNLTTARSAQRAAEVGIRKSMGAMKANLVPQFLGESMVIAMLALLLSVLIVIISLPYYNMMMQKQLTFHTENLPFIVTCAVCVSVVTGLLAGSYPAFFLSSLNPTRVLKGTSVIGGGSSFLRKALVVFQFVITISLISSIVVIQKQLQFIQSASLGFRSDGVIIIPLRTAGTSQQYSTLKTAFQNINGVNVISATTSVPSTPLTTDWGIYKKGDTPDQMKFHDIVRVDADYFKALDIDILAGRDFITGQDNIPSDTMSTTKVILNEASLKEFGIPLEEAVGASVYFQPGQEAYEFTVVGVVKDFHQFSLHSTIKPMLFILPGDRNFFPYMVASLNGSSFEKIRDNMQAIWNSRINEVPLETIFLNENLKTLYEAENRTSAIMSTSTGIALIISCLGLYGLSAYVAERKTREIGIRKVVGASPGNIVRMLSKEYLKLILISFIISVPIGYYFMEKWLEGFAYRTTPEAWLFVISGVVSFLIAWITVSFESYRAALKDPVRSLRTE